MALRNPRWLFIGVNRNTIAFVHPIWMVQYSRRTLLIPNLDTRCGQRLRALRQLSDCPEGAPSAKTLSSPTFTSRCGDREVPGTRTCTSQRKNQPEG
jgi:hypothetical protein